MQKGARYAKNTPGAGDICGRFGWAQGPIPGTGQFYPRDFNLFATNGVANGLRDTGGPVAASSNINLQYFHINNKRQEPVALLSGSGVSLLSGTVYGSSIYRTSFTDPQVTYFDGSRPSAPSNPSPIDFPATTTKLIAMSQALKAYDAIPAIKQGTTVTFRGTDPELNVFTVPSIALSGTYSYTFDVPNLSNVIVNVTGTGASIRYAGFSFLNPFSASTLLWNFPDVTSLVLDSVGFLGSILAPKAIANLQNGSVAGTVVVAAANPANVELYAAPYRVPSSVAARALDIDGSWSFTGNVSDDQTATDFTFEAGFLQVDGVEYFAENQSRTSPTNRMWYSFQPAAIQPKTKPLIVFFNGGPGGATSSLLFAFNTGNWTLDPNIAGTNQIVPTLAAANWSALGNLLYIDAPATGFSYPIANGDGTKPSVGIDTEHEAGTFNRVVLGFLKRHPEILKNRVLIAGESYGGVRSTLMLRHLFNAPSLVGVPSTYIDGPLYIEERDYFSTVFGTTTPTAAQIVTKFGHQALIQPVVAGDRQYREYTIGTPHQFPASNCLSPTCSVWVPGNPGGIVGPACDDYNCDQPVGWSDSLIATASSSLTVVSNLSKALGVGTNIMNIEWMKASSRTTAYGRALGDIPTTPNMTSVFGTLGAEDRYFVTFNDAVIARYPGASDWQDPGPTLANAIAFANNLHNGVSTFITTTKFDVVVYSSEIPYGLAFLAAEQPSLGAVLPGGVSYDPTFISGVFRPGAFWLKYTMDGTDLRQVTMPHVYASGHSITMRTPLELASDARQWYLNSPH